MRILTKIIVVIALVVSCISAYCQAPADAVPTAIPTATQTLLSGVKTLSSKTVIKSVLRIECPKDRAKGTAFVLSGSGIVTTNSHVVGTCAATELVGYSSVQNEPIKFSALEKDDNRDLALLCPGVQLPFNLQLNTDEQPSVETEVETWGYPLRYDGPAPVLSRGYIAGYTDGRDSTDRVKQPRVKHLIINGALNPGNSGGPLIARPTGRVVGIVVEKWTLFSPDVEMVINALQHSPTRSGSALTYRDASGREIGLSNEQITAAALQEIYRKSQVMVGEAISVSELNQFIKEKSKALSCKPSPLSNSPR